MSIDTDFYIRSVNEEKYINDLREIDDDISLLLSQIELLLNTREGDLLGDIEFGVRLEDYIFTFGRNEAEIKNHIADKIFKYCNIELLQKYPVHVDTKFFTTNTNDVCLIDIYIDGRKTIGFIY